MYITPVFVIWAFFLAEKYYKSFPFSEAYRGDDFRLAMNYFMLNDKMKQCVYTGVAFKVNIDFLPRKENFYRFHDRNAGCQEQKLCLVEGDEMKEEKKEDGSVFTNGGVSVSDCIVHKLPAFDCIDSKSELVGKLEYLKELKAEDILRIKNILDFVIELKEGNKKNTGIMDGRDGKQTGCFQPEMKIKCESSRGIYLGTTTSGQRIGYYLLAQEEKRGDFIEKYKKEIVFSFLSSLSEGKRKTLENFYAWKDVGYLIDIYDKDLLMKDCIHSISGGSISKEGHYPYAEKRKVAIYICGGYHVGQISFHGIPAEEIPAYYVRSLNPWESDCRFIRLNYLYDKAAEKENRQVEKKKILNFIWTKKSIDSINFENNGDTHIVFSKKTMDKLFNYTAQNGAGNTRYYTYTCEKEILQLQRRTDAYFLNSYEARWIF